ncbi:RagB/SusD family nutrient uptake outer membrane protein [uncultured Bacteroides sp.]|uniref:RagB/SusD family nutrient uptake outer membrane protein n=1 Tax=uncultured Bacteroides sp. TaxID=162156 RepID=UPI00266FF535|nr:RagB/SusD family nutrient uptake outer membrane protein [uncultured Bacteroides sp.]
MKATHYIYVLFAALFTLVCAGCEDRLNIEKHGSLGGPENYYQTDEEAEAAVASMLISWRDVYSNWFYVKNSLSDDAYTGGGSRGDNAMMEQLNEFTFFTDNGLVSGLYSGLYTVVYKANLIIENVKGDSPIMRRAVAEAKFYRAWSYFELVTLWGTAPLVDHLLSPSEYHVSNSTPEALWAFVEQNLEEAISSEALPSKANVDDADATSRVTLETAKAYLGKAYLFQGKYSDAATVLDEVIDSKKYELYQDSFDMLGHAVTNNCSESMLEVQRRKNSEQAWNQFVQFYIMLGWRTSHMSYGPKALFEEGIAMGTYGFFNPTKSLYDAFVEREGVDGYRLKSTMRTYEQMNEVEMAINPGLYLVGNEGYFFWKTRLLGSDNIIDQSWFQSLQYTNLRVMRYAEVLLMAAEAHVMGGGSADKAVKYINEIRTRAKLAPLSSVTLDDVKKEKRLELCLESVRFQDLVRWGDAKAVLGEQGKFIPAYGYFPKIDPSTGEVMKDAQGNPIFEFKLEPENTKNSVYGFQDKHMLLPIPYTELNVNPNIKQNTGW